MKKINIGLIGLGVIGSGVVKILKERKNFFKKKLGIELSLKKACDKDLSKIKNLKLDPSVVTTNPNEIISDPQIDVVIELIGGIHPAKEFIIEALRKGKHVVTANKALLAQDGIEIFNTARACSKNIYFEAAVGGGIPIIKSLREGLVANKINSLFGIVNGTSNFILSNMSQNNMDFAEALREAQKKGFAEKNPKFDIEGIDSLHKLIILTYLAFGKFVSFKDVFVEGITNISSLDVSYANELGLTIKLLAIAKKENNELEVRVHPTMLPKSNLLSQVRDSFNAIYISGDLVGDLLFYGRGAGQMPTASAVISDLVDLTKDIKAGLFRSTLNIVSDPEIKNIRNIDEIQSRYYIRFMAIDEPGVLAKIAGVLAKFGISIASVSQKERKKAKVV
ncbi:MAG: homoserine dehydrogenase, partial [Candidatus Omnitrophota bacterium]